MSDRPQYLYGVPYAETLYLDPEDLWDAEYGGDPPDSITVEQWTVADPRTLLPSADVLMEYIMESAEVEGLYDEYCRIAPSGGEVEVLIGQALDLMASRVNFYMADKKVATLRLRSDGTLEPLEEA